MDKILQTKSFSLEFSNWTKSDSNKSGNSKLVYTIPLNHRIYPLEDKEYLTLNYATPEENKVILYAHFSSYYKNNLIFKIFIDYLYKNFTQYNTYEMENSAVITFKSYDEMIEGLNKVLELTIEKFDKLKAFS